MKIVLVLIVLTFFSVAGFLYKNSFKKKLGVLKELLEYIDYYQSSICYYKEDLLKINNNYLITHKNKNAKSQLIYLKNNIYKLNSEYISNNLKINEITKIVSYFDSIGRFDYETEIGNNLKIKEYLQNLKTITEEDLRNKGELWFKIFLAIGAVVAIILW